jgi:hypothetical protein
VDCFRHNYVLRVKEGAEVIYFLFYLLRRIHADEFSFHAAIKSHDADYEPAATLTLGEVAEQRASRLTAIAELFFKYYHANSPLSFKPPSA